MSTTILIAEDDRQVAEVVEIALSRGGYATQTARDGAAALRMARRMAPGLVVLDIGLPEMDGLEVCRRLRASSDVPILFLTARDDEVDRVLGLEMGSDDYMTKPFSPRELVARVGAILRRSRPSGGGRALAVGGLTLDPARHALSVGTVELSLTRTELQILQALMAEPERVVRRTALVDAIWGAGADVSDRTLDSHLRNLRAKLADAGCADAIETLHGVGLRMGPCTVT